VGPDGHPFPLGDEQGERLRALARAGGADPRPLLADEATFGSLGSCPRFTEAVRRDLLDLETAGARAVVAARIEDDEQLLAS
jgi:fructuronate reductase/mannitol 2-dehydrogenase